MIKLVQPYALTEFSCFSLFIMVVTVKCDTVCMKYCDILNMTVGRIRYHIEMTREWYDPRPISREHPSITQSKMPGFSLAMEL